MKATFSKLFTNGRKRALMTALLGIMTVAAITLAGCKEAESEEDNSPKVTGVTVTVEGLYAPKGGTLQFSATVTGTNSPSQAVTWSLTTAGVASGTSIDENGLLTVDAAESKTSITVKAVSQQDTSRYGTAYVSVMTANTNAINSVGIIGSLLEVGRVLEVDYVFDSLYGYVTDATFQWKCADTSSGTYTDIPGATGVTYTLTQDDVGKYIKVEAKNAATSSGKLSTLSKGPIYSVLTVISSVTLTGIDAPVTGQALDTALTAPANTESILGSTSISVSWYAETSPGSGTYSYSTGNAAANTRYRAVMSLYPAEGYKFTTNNVTASAIGIDAAYNGDYAANGIKTSSSETSLYIYLYFPATAE